MRQNLILMISNICRVILNCTMTPLTLCCLVMALPISLCYLVLSGNIWYWNWAFCVYLWNLTNDPQKKYRLGTVIKSPLGPNGFETAQLERTFKLPISVHGNLMKSEHHIPRSKSTEKNGLVGSHFLEAN